MSDLTIRLFGGIQLFRCDDSAIPLQIPLQPAVQEFFAYLLLNRSRCHGREVLSGLFWGEREESHARRCLSTALWRLRQELEPRGTPRGTFITTTQTGEIGFNLHSASYWLDVAAFEEKVASGLKSPLDGMGPAEATQLEEAAELYVGDVLEGFYADWVFAHRERLRIQYLRSLDRLMRYHVRRGAFDQSIAYARKILASDPLREEIHRDLMRFYSQMGDRTQALRQYENCCRVLAQELGIEPLPETQALYRDIATANSLSPDSVTTVPGQEQPQNLQQALGQLNHALLSLEEIRGQLHQAMLIVSQFVKR